MTLDLTIHFCVAPHAQIAALSACTALTHGPSRTQFRVWNLPWQKLRNDGHFTHPPVVERCDCVVRGYGGNPDTIVPFPQASLVVSSASDGTVRRLALAHVFSEQRDVLNALVYLLNLASHSILFLLQLRCWSLKTGECSAVFESLLGKVRNVSALPMPGYSPPNSPPSSPPRPVSRSSSNLKARLSAALDAGAAKSSKKHSATLQPVVFSTEGGFLSGIVPPKRDALRERPAPPVARDSLPKRPHWETSRMLQRNRSIAAGPALNRGGAQLASLEEHAQDARAPDADGGGHAERRLRASEAKVSRASILAGRLNARQVLADGDGRSPSALPEWGRPLADMYIAPPPVGHVVTVSTRLNVTGHVDSDDEDGVGPEATFVIAGSGNGRMHFFKYTQAKAPPQRWAGA